MDYHQFRDELLAADPMLAQLYEREKLGGGRMLDNQMVVALALGILLALVALLLNTYRRR